MNRPVLRTFDSHDALYDHAAQFLVEQGRNSLLKRGRFLVALSGGSTPTPLYCRLAQAPHRLEAFWQHTHVFWGDERLLPPDEPGSNYQQAQQEMLEMLPIPAENVHRARGELVASDAAADYAGQLAALADQGLRWPRFDLVLLGMGSDGHIASLFPAVVGPHYDGPVIGVSALYEDRPAARITLTPPVLNSARQILVLVLGASKAQAVAGTLAGAYDPARWPGQRLQPANGLVTWYLDRPASQGLEHLGEKG